MKHGVLQAALLFMMMVLAVQKRALGVGYRCVALRQISGLSVLLAHYRVMSQLYVCKAV